jgi:hypothetical protein
VLHELHVPDHLPGLRVEADDAVGEQVVARAQLGREVRRRIAGGDEQRAARGIEAERRPERAACRRDIGAS